MKRNDKALQTPSEHNARYWLGRAQKAADACRQIQNARDILTAAGMPQSAAYVRRALKSVQGAHRHASRMFHATDPGHK